MKQIIYAVEDDAALQELYAYSLESEFDCRLFNDGKSFFEALKSADENQKPDLILLDIMLPCDDGFAILARLKENKTTAHIPVIMVSAKGDEASKVKGLNMGADDYMAKPFSVLELIARMKANLRKNVSKEASSVAYKDIVVNHTKHQIIANGNYLQLTLKEYNLLSLLCENAEKVQKRDVIFSIVWDDDFIGETRTLDIHIKRLRKKLEESGSKAVIETVRGVGYVLTTPSAPNAGAATPPKEGNL